MKKEFLVENRWLNIATEYLGPMSKVSFYMDGVKVYSFNVRIAIDKTDFFVYTDLSRFTGKKLEIAVEGYRGEDPFSKMTLTDRREGYERIYNEDLRPRFHFSPVCGWLNDPNGLLYYRGTWFMFAQLNPYYHWCDNMHWLLATSTDLIHWEDKGLVLNTDANYQKFSGSGIVDEHNVTGLKEGDDDPILLFYTDAGKDFHQSMAYSVDGGKTFKEYENNPILPQIAPLNRDPKVIPRPDGKGYWMALYLSGNDYALFESVDLINWKQTCVLNLPGCLECPDIYEIALDGDENNTKMVFSCAGGQYLVGRIEDGQFISETEIQKCYCAPFYTVYAPQSFYGAPDNRRIQVICSSNEAKICGEAFCKFITVPCELTLKSVPNGMKLFSNPVKELRDIECNLLAENETFEFTGKHVFNTPESNLFRIEFSVPADFAGQFNINIFNITIEYRGSDHSVLYLNNYRFYADPQGDTVSFDIVVDRCSAELFINGGELYLPAVHPFDWSKTPFSIETKQNLKISALRIAELSSLLPWGRV